MPSYQKILFVSLCSSNDSEGLKQALSLARNNRAQLSVLSIVPSLEGPYKEHKAHIVSAIGRYMDALIAEAMDALEIGPQSMKIETDVVVSGKAAETAIQQVIRHEHDLLIKGCESASEQHGFRAVDMTLLRKCPVPVWLCRPIFVHRQEIKVAVAVDALGHAPQAHDLAVKLLKIGEAQSSMCDGKLRVVSSVNSVLHSELRNNVFLKLPQDRVDEEVQKELTEHRHQLDTLINAAEITGNIEIHQLTGLADDAIPQFVKEHNIDILVMGTLARTGVAGSLLATQRKISFSNWRVRFLP